MNVSEIQKRFFNIYSYIIPNGINILEKISNPVILWNLTEYITQYFCQPLRRNDYLRDIV